MSRPASYCLSIARSMSASARSTSRSSPDTGTANVSPGASMRALAAIASIRAPRSSALTCDPLIDPDSREANTDRLPAAYPTLHAQGSGGRSRAAAGEPPAILPGVLRVHPLPLGIRTAWWSMCGGVSLRWARPRAADIVRTARGAYTWGAYAIRTNFGGAHAHPT